MMRQIDLQEYASSEYPLSVAERDSLRAAIPSVGVELCEGESNLYHLTPGSIVGAVEIGELSVFIRPKIDVPQLLSLACYAMGAFKPQREMFDYPPEYALPDVLALALVSAARQAFARGLLHGYITVEESLYGIRGRVRFDDQIRRRFDIPLPVEVRYDEFTDDVLANQLVKAAAARLSGMRLRSRAARRGLGWIAGVLDNISLVEFSPTDVPNITFDRLNEHCRSVVGLSRLILRHSAFDSERGRIRAAGFLMDMNVIFQEFVAVALRDALGVSARVFRERNISSLDTTGSVRLRPDLTWWHGSSCVFAGDAKYKNITGERIPNADLYQLLAYTTALDLPGGLLIYAKGEAGEAVKATYHVRHSGKRLEIAALDLSGTLDLALTRVSDLANKVRKLRDEARELGHAA